MNIFVLTGAGVSAESGLGTFRDKAGSGIWAKFDPMKLATPEAFAAHPEEVHAFYNMRRRDLDLPPESGGMRSEYQAATRMVSASMLARASAGVR